MLDNIMSQLPPGMREFIDFGFCRNCWLWLHAMAGAIGGKIGGMIAPWLAVMIVALVIAIVWELFEFIAIEKRRPSKRFFADAFGDVSMALFFCAMAI